MRKMSKERAGGNATVCREPEKRWGGGAEGKGKLFEGQMPARKENTLECWEVPGEHNIHPMKRGP